VTDLPLDITSVEFGESVQHWIDQARVSSSSLHLRTDADGRLRLDGLPRGDYAWSVIGADGNPVTGTFTVLPKQVADVELDLP
jgi:methionine-rich copper-binding protein CopC